MRNPIVNMHQSHHEFQEVWEHNVYGVSPDDITEKHVLDIGAHYGYFSLLALKLGCKSVVAVEANPSTIPILTENLSQFPSETKIIHGAVTGDGIGQVWLNRSVVCPKVDVHGDIEVQAISLERCMPEGDDIFLKMDIEFAEFEVLFNAPGALLRRFSTICMEIHELENRTCKAMRDYLNVVGFEMVHRVPLVHWEWGPNGEQLNMRDGGAENVKFKRR